MVGRDGRPLIVAAVGGNALLRRGESPELDDQIANMRHAASLLARLTFDADLVVTHGNGPQVGVLAAMGEAAGQPMRLDVLDAETQGQIGYLLTIEIANESAPRRAVTLLTQVEVDRADPAFDAPSKPIGIQYDEATARALADQRGWDIGRDGAAWRRVVPSPEPIRIIELDTISMLVAAGTIVVCAGGGGIPVSRHTDGRLEGVEAVVDKDLTASLLATALGADQLLLLTDVDAVYDHWGTEAAVPLGRIDPASLRRRDLPSGSMGPKAEAACRFAETGGFAAIGALAEAAAISLGQAGTIVTER